MAGDWIKIEHATPDKPEVFAMANALGIDPDAVMGKLVRLWIWADQQTIFGNANCNGASVTDFAVDRITHCPGFAQALRAVGWLLDDGSSLSLVNFDRHNGQTAKDRAVTNRRVTEHRKKKRECNGATVTAPCQKSLPEKRREESIGSLPAGARDAGDFPGDDDALSLGDRLTAEAFAEELADPGAIPDYRPPTLDELRHYAATVAVPMPVVTLFFDDMEACGWVDAKSRPIRAWRPALTAYFQRYQANNAGGSRRLNGRTPSTAGASADPSVPIDKFNTANW